VPMSLEGAVTEFATFGSRPLEKFQSPCFYDAPSGARFGLLCVGAERLESAAHSHSDQSQ